MAYIKKEPIVEFITKGLNNPDKTKAYGYDAIEILTEIEYAPEADVVSTKAFEQVKWERDTAIEQLQSYGVGFCENKELAEVKHGEWIYKHRHRGGFVKRTGYDEFGNLHTITVDDRFEINDPYCSVCGKLGGEFLNYCGNCGAKMNGGVQG